jgi:S-DNA-T family DNA segregation ATPase FtsK/SpoIIIE
MTRKRSQSPPASEPPSTWDETLIKTLLPLRIELAGIVLMLVSMVLLLGVLDLLPFPLLNGVGSLAYQLFGWGVYPLCGLLLIAGLYMGTRRFNHRFRLRPGQIIGLELLLLAALPLTHLASDTDLNGAVQGQGGGLVGWALATPTIEFLGPVLTILLYAGLLVAGVMLIWQIRWRGVMVGLANLSLRLRGLAERLAPPPRPPKPAPAGSAAHPPITVIDEGAELIRPVALPGGRDPRLPPISILEEGVLVQMPEAEVEEKTRIVEQTLRDFGLVGTVTEIRRGPAVTQFGVQPGYLERTGPDGEPMQVKVRVGQIAALRQDLALALAVTRLRIQAPVPGRGIVGLEIPNAETSIVRIRTIVESPAFAHQDEPLAVALGQGVSGVPLAVSLARMPHLLIAGATGTGKSVCLNAFISCLVFNNSPDTLRLVMIDPKKVELIRFNGLPHLLGKVEVEHERVTGVLRWLMQEMDERYQKFAAIRARNLEAYNAKVRASGKANPLPYIAVFIDELADLMVLYPAEVESALCRLAQMARATGIHLVVATQRPSTDVLTGLIKANFPARIAFAVASGVDSRVILDSVGAEHLLGRGDMLFLSSDASVPMRVQSCFVGDNEIERLVRHWQRMMPKHDPGEAPWERIISRQQHIDETDDMLEEAIELVQQYDTISTSFIQRRLRVGYPRAARLMEALYEMGLVEDPREGGQTRQVYVDKEGPDPLDQFLNNQDED